jgi:hypothetical protein
MLKKSLEIADVLSFKLNAIDALISKKLEAETSAKRSFIKKKIKDRYFLW